MAINNFIPAVWSARILDALRKALVYGQPMIVNREYEGEIKAYGDTVKINSIGDPTIFDYTKNSDMPAAETLNDSQKTLQITQAKAFNFQVDDVDKAQQQPKVMDAALSRAAYRMADIADQYVAAQMVAGSTTNTIGTDALPIVAPTATSGSTGAYEQLVDLSVKLDEQNVPTDGRWVVIPPWYHGEQRAHGGGARWRGQPGHPPQGRGRAQHRVQLGGADQLRRGVPPGASLRRRREGAPPVRWRDHPARGARRPDHDPLVGKRRTKTRRRNNDDRIHAKRPDGRDQGGDPRL
jgi:hypothetical protein